MTPSEATNDYVPASADGPAQNVPVPKLPKAAGKKSERGAKEFMEYYLKTMNYSLESYDAKPLIKLTSDNCRVCYENIIQGIRFNDEQGGWQIGGLYDFSVYSAKFEKNEAVVGFFMKRNPSTLYKRDGSIASEKDEQSGKTEAVAILQFDSKWIVDSISIND